MPGLFKFLRKEKDKESVPQVYIDIQKVKDGVRYSLYREKQENSVQLPLKLSIYELKQQENIHLLEILEELWLDEVLQEQGEGYIFPYALFKELPLDVKEVLSIPKPTALKVKLGHEGAVGLPNFKFVLEKNYEQWKHLEKTSRQIGPWVLLPDGTELLMDEKQYELQVLLEQAPSQRDKDNIFAFVAQVRNKAKQMNIPMDEYLEKQEYLFVDGFQMDVSYDQQEIVLQPLYQSTDPIPANFLDKMSKSSNIYATGPNNQKIFVNPGIQQQVKQIRDLPPIKGADIPKFVENPEAFLPEISDLDLSLFSDRVKSLGIQVYRAQPYVHAEEKERGWFSLDIGFSAVDETGEAQDEFQSNEIIKLIQEAQDNSEEYINWNGKWLKIPQDADQFVQAAQKLQEEVHTGQQIDITKLPYVLEIFENISQLEFNAPILEVQQQMSDMGVLNSATPPSFLAQLKPFQTEGYIWMKSLYYRRIGGLLADDMGLGKTIQVISFLTYLQERELLTPTLLVVPKTLIENWEKEMKKFSPLLASSIYIHSGTQRVKNPEWIKKRGITITTYQTLVKDQLVFGQIDWQAVICDEAQAIKNPTTAVSRVIKAMKTRFRLALTGTPVENSLGELWSIMDFVQPGLLGSLSEFKKEFVNKMEHTDSGTEAEQQLIARVSKVYKRRTKSEELAGQLPAKTIVVREVPMGNVQKELYKEVVTLVRQRMLSGLEAIQKLKSLSSHPALVNEAYNSLPAHEIPKLEEALKILDEVQRKGEKALIFTEYIQMQNILRRYIRERFNINPMIINGMTSRRQQHVDLFNKNPGFDILILSPKAAGTGLTITSANHVVHYTRWWNPAVENQATDRVYRIGQDKPVYVYYPIVMDKSGFLKDGTVEQIVHRILEEKQGLAANVIVPSKKVNIEDEVLRGLMVH